jgi:hypothetical protein
VLAAPLTDLLLAGDYAEFFRYCVHFARRRFGARVAFETNNLGHLLARLGSWGVAPDFVIGPVNPLGLLMKPTPARVLAALRESAVPVLAKCVTAGGAVSPAEGAAFARAHGARGVVVDLDELGIPAR